MMTHADLLAMGLNLPALTSTPTPIPGGATCAITGIPLTEGYPASQFISTAQAEFLETFHGNPHGWFSPSAARVWTAASPRAGNPPGKSTIAFEDGTCFQPLIDRVSAERQGRACWSTLVREVWPRKVGQQCFVMLTTDTKKRVWPRGRAGVLGPRTPVLIHDLDTSVSNVFTVDWARLLVVLAFVEEVYTLGFSKRAIVSGLYQQHTLAEQVGLILTMQMERRLTEMRMTAEFSFATLIAQRQEVPCPAQPAKPLDSSALKQRPMTIS